MFFGYDGDIFEVVEFLHVKPGKGPAFVRTKIRNMRTGALIDKTFRAGEKVDQIRVESRAMEYLYPDGDGYVFMDQQTYDQIHVASERLGDKKKYLKENLVIDIQMNGEEILGIELPQFLEFTIVYTEPGEKGNTVSNTLKKAEVETGAIVMVPLFIESGERIKVDTRTDRYIERVK